MKRLLCLALAVSLTASPVYAADKIIGKDNVDQRFKDMGDGTWAQVIATSNAAGTGSSPTTPSYTAPVAGSSPTSTAATSGQLTGTPIDLQLASGTQFQISGLNADSLAITQGMGPNCATATYVTATVLKYDLTTVAASALTGASANGIYSVMVFGGCLKITRTGSADTLTVTYRGTN